jgi:hypothetical protein
MLSLIGFIFFKYILGIGTKVNLRESIRADKYPLLMSLVNYESPRYADKLIELAGLDPSKSKEIQNLAVNLLVRIQSSAIVFEDNLDRLCLYTDADRPFLCTLNRIVKAMAKVIYDKFSLNFPVGIVILYLRFFVREDLMIALFFARLS